MKNPIVSIGVLLLTVGSAFPANLVVTTLSDSGPGSLRQAIVAANADPGSLIEFDVAGTISLSTALPAVTARTSIDARSAPGYVDAPVVGINFNGRPGLQLAAGSSGSSVYGLALFNALGAGLTVASSDNTIASNFIGLDLAGDPAGNTGDGIRLLSTASGNIIGRVDPVKNVTFFEADDPAEFPIQPVTAWQGLRNFPGSSSDFVLCGTSGSDGLLYVGPIDGGGDAYQVIFPGSATIATSVYGPDTENGTVFRLVGSYRLSTDTTIFNRGFIWEGELSDLPSGGVFRSIDYPGAVYQFTHSTMGGLAVGNADGPKRVGKQTLPIGPGVAYIYDVEQQRFVANVVFPGSKSNTAYGIWWNGGSSYTICGGYSPLRTQNLEDQSRPLDQGRAYLVDYDASTGKFSNWKSFSYPAAPGGEAFITHFEGISSSEPGVYQMSADSVSVSQDGPVQGSWVTVRRNPDGSFSDAEWAQLTYSETSVASSNSVYGQQVVGIVVDGDSTFSFQATVNLDFQLSNVISANRGNGIGIYGSHRNVVSMNFIGSDPNGSDAAGFGNTQNGILITSRSRDNLIGGQSAGPNNPTGTKGETTPVFFRPPQGNLISGNGLSGVSIADRSQGNILSGNFIGTDESGNAALANRLHGVWIHDSPSNSLIGCTLRQNPFVFYNVIAGNLGDGVRVTSSDNVVIHANFLGIGADNATIVANRGNGLTVNGTSKNTTVGGVIPLGNVISGNDANGIAVLDSARGFISFNTFGGVFAFGGAAPNGMNGILITSTGGNNSIQTCILSGNAWNGIHIGGAATGVQVLDTACGTNTVIDAAIPNGMDGILISGTASNNAIGGFKPSVETRNHIAGNAGYGINITGQAGDNAIYNTHIGLGDTLSEGPEPSIPNGWGGVILDQGTSGTTIGGTRQLLGNRIETNLGGGLIINASTRNNILGNTIRENDEFGIYGYGACDRTLIQGNTITGNGAGPSDNVDIAEATGIRYVP